MNGSVYACRADSVCSAHVMEMKRPVLIVLDLDGTLTDSFMLGRVLFKRVFALLGFGEISDELADSFNGPSADEVCRVMGLSGARKAEYNRLIDEIEIDLVRTIGKVYPGVHEMLAALCPHAHLAILTNGAPSYLAACIDTYGFAPYIGLRSGYTEGVSKAERIRQWERELSAQRVIVVGDRSTDIANARAAGAYAVGVTYGMGSREELLDADVLCASAAQVTSACMDVISRL